MSQIQESVTILNTVSKVKKGLKYIRKNPNYIRRRMKHYEGTQGLRCQEASQTEKNDLRFIRNLLKQFWKHLKVIRKRFKDINEGFNRDKEFQKQP